MSAAPSQAGRMVLGGRVEHFSREGQALVLVQAGCFVRVVACPAVEGVGIGDEVVVELGHDLKHGIIQQRPALPRFKPTRWRR